MAALTVPALLARLRAEDSGHPRLTWYGADGERVELSARVLENWVAKTGNLLVEEGDVEPGARVLLDLPPHWRTAVWTLACWAVGTTPTTLGRAGELDDDEDEPGADVADVVVTTPDRAGLAHEAPRVIAVDLAPLAWSAGDLPAGVLDYNAVVAGMADQLLDGDPADVSPLLADAPPWEAGAPLLEEADDYDPVASLLAPLAAGSALVLRGPGAPAADHVADQERAVRRSVPD